MLVFTGGKKWVPLEIGPPPSSGKLRGKVVNRSNSEYSVTNELLNGTNGYGEDYKSKFGSGAIQRNRSQRARRIGGEMTERYGKAPQLAYPIPVAGTVIKPSIPPTLSVPAAQDADLNKKLGPFLASPLSPGSQASLVTTVNAVPMPYARRNTGPRGGARGGLRGGISSRPLNRSRSQTGVDGIVPVSAVSSAVTLTNANPTTSTANSSLPHPDEFSSDVGQFYYPYFLRPMDVRYIPITSAGPTSTFMPSSYFYNTPFITYDSDRLKDMLRSQIEYYFSEENLQRDFFLRRKMDEGGFLPISLIASFHRVQALTQDVSLVVDALTNSNTVEIIDGVKLRTRQAPERWPLVSRFLSLVINHLIGVFSLQVGQFKFCNGNRFTCLSAA